MTYRTVDDTGFAKKLIPVIASVGEEYSRHGCFEFCAFFGEFSPARVCVLMQIKHFADGALMVRKVSSQHHVSVGSCKTTEHWAVSVLSRWELNTVRRREGCLSIAQKVCDVLHGHIHMLCMSGSALRQYCRMGCRGCLHTCRIIKDLSARG